MTQTIFTSAAIVEEHFTDVCNLKASPEPAPYSVFRDDHVPNWLRLKILDAGLQRGKHSSPSGWSVFESARRKFGGCWVDHAGSAVLGGARVFVSQPYGLHKRAVQELLAFCRGVGVDCLVDPRSQWNPGATVSVTIIPPSSNVYFAGELQPAEAAV